MWRSKYTQKLYILHHLSLHILLATVVCSILYLTSLVSGLFAVIFLLWSVLIDVDHLIYFAVKHHAVNISQWIKIGKVYRQAMQANLYIFHSPEINILWLLMSFVHPVFPVIFLSSILHLVVDMGEHYLYWRNWSWLKQWSMMYHLFNRIKTKLAKKRIAVI